MEFENCDDEEIGSDNIFKRAIEEAIISQRPISIGEYNAFTTSIGALVPGFVIKSLPKLTFNSLIDSVKATAQAIEFIKAHPSLPVSFNVKKAIHALHEYLQRQETFLALQEVEPNSSVFSTENWAKFKGSSLAEPSVALAKLGKVSLLRVLLERHVDEIRESLRMQGQSLVSGILALVPNPSEHEEELIQLIREVIRPQLDEIEELARVLVERARVVGESDLRMAQELLSLATCQPVNDSEYLTPLESIRAQIIQSEREAVAKLTKPMADMLGILTVATHDYGLELSDSFNLAVLEADQAGCLTSCGKLLVAAAIETAKSEDNLDISLLLSFCEKFNIDKNPLIAQQIRCIKDELVNSKKRTRLSSDQTNEMESSALGDANSALLSILFDLISALEDLGLKSACIYESLIGLNALNVSQAEIGRFEDLAREIAETGSATTNDSIELLRSYVSVLSVQKILLKYPQFAFIRDRPDFLMKRDNVMAVVTELSCGDGLSDVFDLATVFTYIDVKECVLVRLACLLGVYRIASADEDKSKVLTEIKELITRSDSDVTSAFLGILLDEHLTEPDVCLFESLSEFVAVPSEIKTDFCRMKLLLRDFDISLTRGELHARREFAAIDFFAKLAGNDITGMARLERAKVVFGLESEEVDLDPVERLISDFKRLKPLSVPRSQLLEFMGRASDLLFTETDGVDKNLAQLVEEVLLPLQTVLSLTHQDAWEEYQWSADARPMVDEVRGIREFESIAKSKSHNIPSDHVLFLNAISAETASESSWATEFEKLGLYYRLRSFLAAKRQLYPSDVFQVAPPVLAVETTQSQSSDSVMANRCQWASYLESLSIAFDRDVLFGTLDLSNADHRKNAKSILVDIFPQIIKKSKFDLDIAIRFGDDFGRSPIDIKIKWLEMVIAQGGQPIRTSKAVATVLDELLSDRGQRAVNAHKIMTFIIPALTTNDSVQWLTAEVLVRIGYDECGNEWGKVSRIIAELRAVESSGFHIDFHSIFCRNIQPVVDLINQNMNNAHVVNLLISLLQQVVDTQTLSGVSAKIVERIVAYPEVVVSGQVSVDCITALVDVISGECEKYLRRLIQTMPLCDEQLILVNKFMVSGFSGISETDLKLLQNRLAIRHHGWNLDDKIMEVGLSAKKILEFIMATGGSGWKELVDELVTLNEVDADRLRVDILKRWVTDDDNLNIEKVSRVAHHANDPEAIITCLLKLYFGQKISVANKLVCFRVLFSVFGKEQILRVYNNRIDDLVSIQKQLSYLHSLSETHKVVKPMEYKDFVLLDKALVVKNITNSGSRALLPLAMDVAIDFSITDYELIEKLETKLKTTFGAEGIAMVRRMRTKMSPSNVFGAATKPKTDIRKVERQHALPLFSNENVIQN